MINPSQETNRFFQKVYNWMFIGLIISGITAFGVASSETLSELILGNQFIFWGLLIRNEIEIMHTLYHKNIVRIYATDENNE